MKKYSIWIIITLLWTVLPMVWQLICSFTTNTALVDSSVSFSQKWTLYHYKELFMSDPPFWRYLMNSSIVATITTILTLILSIPGAYALSNMSIKWSKFAKIIIIAAAMFPYVLLFLALLELARLFGLGNNLIALCLPYCALSLPLALLLLTSAFDGLPKDLDSAAKLEGMSLLSRLRWILIPLITPASASTSILVFLFSWNEYPIALTWISRTELLTLPVAIARIAGSSIYSIPYGTYAAATVIGSIPLLLIVLIFQKQIVSGLTSGAVK